MTTALAIYDPDAVDAGRGLRFSGPWLVSSPGAARVRWMAPWLQVVISEGWNATVLAVRWLGPRLTPIVRWTLRPRRLGYIAVTLAVAAAVAIALIVQPLVLLSTGLFLGAGLGLMVIGGMGPREASR